MSSCFGFDMFLALCVSVRVCVRVICVCAHMYVCIGLLNAIFMGSLHVLAVIMSKFTDVGTLPT